MKKRLQLLLIFIAGYTFNVSAQSFTISGPRTIFDLATEKGTNKYTFFNFDTGREVSPIDSNSGKWDIGFSGTTIILNGGTSGPGNVTAQLLTATSFESQTSAPVSGYASDRTSKVVPTGAGNGWYNYYPGAAFNGPHTIIPIADRLIAIKLSDGRYVKLQILNYYQGAPLDVPTTGPAYEGVGKYYSFRYLVTPEGTNDWSAVLTKISNLSTPNGSPQYFNLASGNLLSSDEVTSGASWNVVFKNTSGLGTYDNYNIGIFPNTGTNGTSYDSLQLISADFNTIDEAPVSGWQSNTAPVWYAYNPSNHTINPKANTSILVKTALNRYAKIRIESYYEDPSDPNSYEHYTFSYYFQPDGTTNLETPAITTGIEETSASASFSIYPNPLSLSNQFININLEQAQASVKILDAMGKQVFHETLSGNTANLQPNLSAGMYLITVEQNGKIAWQKLLVQ